MLNKEKRIFGYKNLHIMSFWNQQDAAFAFNV